MESFVIKNLKAWLTKIRDGGVYQVPDPISPRSPACVTYGGATLRYIQELEDKVAEQAVLLQRKVAGDPENKNWETSYTKIVYTDLLMGRPGARITAADLLRDYHDTAHVVYEQRDRARRDLAYAQVAAQSYLTSSLYFGARGKAVTEELRQMRIQRNQARNESGVLRFQRNCWAAKARDYALRLGMIKRIAS